MQVIRSGQPAPLESGSVVTIGAYDGVHLGHRHLLSHVCELAESLGLQSVVVTFDRHPASVVRPESAPPLLTDLNQKLELLETCGIDLAVVIPFDLERSRESPEDFVARELVAGLRARVVIVGEDFHFGHRRLGNVTLLRTLGHRHGFEVEGVVLEGTDGMAISSTRIRQLVASGDVAGAAALLGRPHQVRGTVVRGDGRGGASLGFPTANLSIPPEIAVPGVGIYAARYLRTGEGSAGEKWLAAVSVGYRPTFYDPEGAAAGPPLLEAFLLDFSGDLYGESAGISFEERLRSEERFDRMEDLVAQMHRDVDAVRVRLSSEAN